MGRGLTLLHTTEKIFDMKKAALCLLVSCATIGVTRAEIVISEFMASNRGGLQDEDGNFSDWIEICNPTSSAIDLDGWYLTDDREFLAKWRFPAITIPARGYQIIFASEKNRRVPGLELHTNFRLERDGEYLAVVGPDGTSISFHYTEKYPQQFSDVSYGLRTDSVTERFYYVSSTPGQPNGSGLPGVATKPAFARSSQAFVSNFSLELSAADPDTTIRYTTSGADPSVSSAIYSSPIGISRTMVVKARSFRAGLLPSEIVEHSFVKLSSTVRNVTSNVALVIANTFGSSIPSNSFRQAHVHIVDVDGATGRASITGKPDFTGFAGLKTRGSSTGGREKASLAFEIWDAEREDRDMPILGMPPESDWILYGPYNFDRALIRNAFIYELSNQTGNYATRSRFVELYLNTGTGDLGTSHYWGVYVLMEKIKRGPDRVDVERMTPGDNSAPGVTGGYMLKIDRADPGDAGFSAGGQTLRWVYPKEEEATPAQRSYISSYVNDMVAALDTRDMSRYGAYIDIPSWIDHHLLNVLSLNADALRLSTYMYKPREGKYHYGPIWDFDRSMESYDGRDDNPESWSGGTNYFGFPWWNRLFDDPDFYQLYRDRWWELREDEFSTANIDAIIDGMADEVREPAVRNYQRWNLSIRGGSVQGEIDHMKDWLRRRLEWIDSQWPQPPRLSSGSAIVSAGFELAMSAGSGTLYYTLDGSDPRLPGGGVSPLAIQYGTSDAAVLLAPETHKTVRVHVPRDGTLGMDWAQLGFDDSSWTTSTTGIGVGYERGSGYQDLIDVDVGGEMYDQQTSVYIRVEFEVEDPSPFAFLSLNMKYDDAFVAYLNGVRVAASSNAPAAPSWDSGANGTHDDGAAVNYQPFDISEHLGRLVVGRNVLAIQGLNNGTTSSDLIFVPEIRAAGTFSGEAIAVDDFTRIFARTRSDLENVWSGPSRATFALDDAMALRVTEIMYHPPDPVTGPYIDEDFEFIEIQNTSATTIDLRGVRLTSGVQFDFADGSIPSLPARGFVLVVNNRQAFEELYDIGGLPIAGEYTGNLENQGERIRLENGAGELIQEFVYRDFWYPETDGPGHSLLIADPLDELDMWNRKEGWLPSDILLGTPGESDDLDGGRRLPGDANQDSFLEIGDAVTLLLLLFRAGEQAPPCEGASVAEGGNVLLADFNGDAGVDSSDVVALLSYLFLGGPAHALGENCTRIEGCESVCGR